jgi:hypothetical protein
VSLIVEDVQPSLFPLPPRMPEYRRVSCGCGCGCWFYARRAKGRPPKYVNEEHARREYAARDREAHRANPEPERARHRRYRARKKATP